MEADGAPTYKRLKLWRVTAIMQLLQGERERPRTYGVVVALPEHADFLVWSEKVQAAISASWSDRPHSCRIVAFCSAVLSDREALLEADVVTMIVE